MRPGVAEGRHSHPPIPFSALETEEKQLEKNDTRNAVMMLKTWPPCTSAESNLRDRVFGEIEKNSFIALPGKGRHRRVMPQKLRVSTPGGFDEEFYSDGSRAGF